MSPCYCQLGLLTFHSASSSYVTELVRGMTLEQASKVKNTEIAKELVSLDLSLVPCFLRTHMN